MIVNNILNFRMKKQIKDYVENNKILAEKSGDYYLFLVFEVQEKMSS